MTRSFALLFATAFAAGAMAAEATKPNAPKSDSANLKAAKPAEVGKRVGDFTLKDYHGQPVSLASYKDAKLVVVAFLGTECPLAKLYARRLVELAKEFQPRGVAFVGVNPNRQDSPTEIAAYARLHEIEFPILKDLGQTLADHVGATRTPEVVVLDGNRVIRYRGRIDDQYGFQQNASYQKKTPERRDLAEALNELLAGKPVSQPTTPLAGCLIGRDRRPKPGSDVTYSKQIARIMNANCVFCHRAGQIAPFTLTNYDDVVGWAAMIDEVVQAGRMPPWHADSQFGHFKNDARLSDKDKATIARWVANGAPEGDPQDLPKPPKFAEGWMIPKPDEVIYMADKPFEVPATGVVDYQNFVVDPGWKEDKWISAIEPRPGNPAVVHHILLFVKPPEGVEHDLMRAMNDFTGAFAPGLRPEPLPAGYARKVQAGSKLIFQLHYTPNGSKQQDRSYVGLTFADPKTVKKEVQVQDATNFVFQIPPGDDDFGVQSRYVFRKDAILMTLMPHMHLRGKSFSYQAVYPDGKSETLLSVPRYDFGWQTNYRLAEPKLIPKGTRLDCIAHFDNSEENLNNPDPKATVGFGDQTFDEMMIGFFELADAHQDLTAAATTSDAKRDSRVDEFLVVMQATRGEPDDNFKAATALALSAPEWFGRFNFILPVTVPQVDRACVTAVVDGKLVQKFGPFQQRRRMPDAPQPPETIRSDLAPVDAQGEPLAEYAAGNQVIVNPDLSKVSGAIFETMRKRGAKSSLHIPVELGGVRATVNFWSTDADAFPQPAVQLLSALVKVMTTPHGKG
jgi:peroxiredoxin